MGRFEDEARQEIAKTDAYKQWVRARVAAIHERISAADVLRQNGVRLRYGGNKPEQISCPFHGKDNRPSARFHPGEGRSPSGIWCFVCNKRWDAIGLWREFAGFEGSFGGLLRTIERAYGIDPPDAPALQADEPEEDVELAQLFEACERRLRNGKRAFTLDSFAVVSSVLERLYFRTEKGTIAAGEAKAILRKTLDRIGEKERACLAG